MRLIHRGILATTLAIAIPATLSACSSGEDKPEGKVVGSVDRGPTKEVRQSGDTLKVVALGWSDGEIALSLGVKPTAIYDWQGHGEDNLGVGPWATEKFGDSKPTVIENTGTSYNYEQIELLEPDVILNVRAAGDELVFDRLSKIAPVAAAPEGTGDFAVDWRTQTEIIGKAIGKDEEAKKAVAETDKVIADTAEEHPEFRGKSFVYGVKFGDAYGAYLAGDARFDVFAALGFTVNEPVTKLQANGFFASVPTEKVSALDADVAILSTIALPYDDLTSDPLVSSLDVVKDQRAVMVEESEEINSGLAAGTPQSILIALEAAVPDLSVAAKKSTSIRVG